MQFDQQGRGDLVGKCQRPEVLAVLAAVAHGDLDQAPGEARLRLQPLEAGFDPLPQQLERDALALVRPGELPQQQWVVVQGDRAERRHHLAHAGNRGLLEQVAQRAHPGGGGLADAVGDFDYRGTITEGQDVQAIGHGSRPVVTKEERSKIVVPAPAAKGPGVAQR